MTFNQNKLGNDPSPYLQQHKNNPVNWQTWNKDILEISKKSSLVGLLNINDIIIEVQKTPITKSVDLNNIVNQIFKKGKKTLLITVINKENQRRYLGVKIN